MSISVLRLLESILKSTYKEFKVVIVDNGSPAQSIKGIKDALKSGFSDKRIHFLVHDTQKSLDVHIDRNDDLVLIECDENRGFGWAGNIGIRIALQDSRCKYVWILNNDTLVDQEALYHLVQKMETDESLGACGATILYYDRPDCVQSLGGFVYYPWVGYSRQIGNMKSWSQLRSSIKELEPLIEQKMYWVQGASIFLTREFLKSVGFFSEEYFLYFEEQDFGVRSKKKFKNGYASSAIVYHKEGLSTGSGSVGKKSLLTEFFMTRSRLIFTKKYYPYFLMNIYIVSVLLFAKKMLTLKFRNGLIILMSTIYFLIFGKNLKNQRKLLRFLTET